MPKIAELLKSALPAQIVSENIWAKIEPLGGRESRLHLHGYKEQRRESRREIFEAGKGTRMHKRVRANCAENTGSIVVGVRVGTFTTCVCKHKM